MFDCLEAVVPLRGLEPLNPPDKGTEMTTQEKLDVQTLLEWHLKQLHQAEEEANKTLTAFHDTAATLLTVIEKGLK